MNLDYKPKNNQSIFPTTEEQTSDLAVDKKRKLVFLTEKEQLLKSGQSTLLSEQAAIIKPIEIQNNKPIDVKVVKSHHSVSAFDLNRLILNPHAEGLNLLKSLVEVDRYYLEKATKDLESNFVEKESVSKQQLATFVNEGSSEYRKTGDLVNIVISREVITRHLPEKAIFYGVKRLLILTDVDSQQTSKYYRLMLKTLAQYGVETLEFTNIQPYFNVATLNEVANFGLNHAIDGVLAFGSWTLIDFAKMAIAKMTQPTIRLELLKQKVHRQIAKAYEKTNYIMFSLTTVVCPGPFNARTILVTGDYLPQVERKKTRSNQVLTSWPMVNSVDNSDCAFFLPEIFADLPKGKLKELIVEIFFRIIINFADPNIQLEVQEIYVHDLISLKGLLNKLIINKMTLTFADYDLLSLIIARSVDGSSFVESPAAWNLYLLEAGFSAEFNTKRSDVLSLIAPYYLMKLVEKSQVLKKRYSYLSRKLFNRHYIEGFVYELIRFAELYELPRCLLDLIDLQQISAEKFVNTLKFGTNYLPTKTPFFEQLLREIPLH